MLKAIPLLESKLPTLPATRKKSGDAMTRDLHFFDPKHLFESIMSSDIGKKVHQGFGMWVDNETECWHNEAWLSSYRSTSGHHAYYPDGKQIFPSGFIRYNISEGIGGFTLGRVIAVGQNYRSDAHVPGQVTLAVMKCFTWDADLEEAIGQLEPPMTEYELLLCWIRLNISLNPWFWAGKKMLSWNWVVGSHNLPMSPDADEEEPQT